MASEEHERLADELEKQTDRMERQSAELEGKIDDARTDWRSKQEDPGVPGAVKPQEDADEDPPGPRSST